MSKKDWAVAAALALCAIVVVACGSGGDGSGGGGAEAAVDAAAIEDGRVEMTECLREHGLDVPDPAPGQEGLIFKGGPGSKNGIDPSDPATKAAFEACEEEVDFKPPQPTAEQEEEMQEAMLAFAQCMREHGVDMPDPEFAEGGKVTMRIDGSGAPNADEPAVEAAQKACEGEMPDGAVGP